MAESKESQKIIANSLDKLVDYKLDTYVELKPADATVPPLFYDVAEGYNAQSKDLAAIAKKYTDGTERYLCVTLSMKTPINLEDNI